MNDEGTFYLKKATEDDLSSLLRVISGARAGAAEHLTELFSVENSPGTQGEVLRKASASHDTAFFLAGFAHHEPSAALWCRHLENAPPVYQPDRSILSVNSFHTSADAVALVGSHLLDAAIKWAKSVSARDTLLVSTITWAHDTAMRHVSAHYHTTSTLRESAGYHDLFTLEGEDARMRPATEWYFGRSYTILSTLRAGARQSQTVRRATPSDLPRIVELSRRKRHDYARYQPIFWRPAKDAEQKQLDFFGWLLQQEAPLLFVSEASDASLHGFIIAMPGDRLPLNDPALRLVNGLHIDDFTVADEDLWSTVGRDLLFTAVTAHQDRVGTEATINVISGTHDRAKRKLLEGDAHMRSLFTWNILPAGNFYKGSDT